MIYIVLFKFHKKLFITYQIQIFSSVKGLIFNVKEIPRYIDIWIKVYQTTTLNNYSRTFKAYLHLIKTEIISFTTKTKLTLFWLFCERFLNM